MIKVNFQKKDLWLLAAVMVFVIGVGYVIAWGSGDYLMHGHDKNEIGNLKIISNLECVSGGGINHLIYNSSLNKVYNLADVFNETSGPGYPIISCKPGWTMTGCAATTSMLDKGNNEYMAGTGECRGSAGGTDSVYIRCCRLIFSDSDNNNWKIHGHNSSDISNMQKNLECIQGSYNETGIKNIGASSLGNTYTFDSIFIGAKNGNYAEIESLNGWIMTDCSSASANVNSDNDEYMLGTNKCRSADDSTSEVIFGRACRISSFGQGNSLNGHDSGEIGNLQNQNLECLYGSYNENGTKIIETSTLGNNYNFGNVFEAEITSFSVDGNEPVLGCINGWAMTGCSSATLDTDAYDNDEYMIDKNKCRGDQRGNQNVVYTRCCRLV